MKLKLVSISLFALAAASPAVAFDTVTWNWNADVVSTVTTTSVSDIAISPTGLEQVESEQSALGDFTATSSSTAISNDIVSLGGMTTDDIIEVETSASALGNSASFEADVSMQLDASQVFGGADASLLSGLTGGIADVSLPGLLVATATTTGVINGTVDSDATAVANNLTANIATTSGSDGFLIGNNIQSAYAVTTATSTVDAVAFADVVGLRTLGSPAVSSLSTAVGNNLSVSIDGIN
ncbi:MAG: hypothetical protein HUJ27_03190 [Rhodobacteraceae bacterium]|nr:hypothetical protein [Paracoccaceae bacterium]